MEKVNTREMLEFNKRNIRKTVRQICIYMHIYKSNPEKRSSGIAERGEGREERGKATGGRGRKGKGDRAKRER